jgi:aryl-alcohol dehydrogenase-like predicted oxidoreductase
MRKRELGNTGIVISETGFGAWAMGGRSYGTVPEADAFASLRAFVEAGGDFIDTARAYGASEELLGRFLKRDGLHDKVVIATKTSKILESEIREHVETSLRMLQTDCIGLLYLHSPPDEPGAMERALDVLQDLKTEGKIRATGASVKGPDVTQSTVDLCRHYIRSGKVDALQVIYSIFRQKNAEMFAEAAESDVAIIARTILESGFLTGKYRPGHEFSAPGDHRRRWSRECLERIFTDVQSVTELAVHPPFESVTQVAIRFVLDTPHVTAIIPGAKNAEQMSQNMALAGLPPLDPEIMTELQLRYAGSGERFNTDRKRQPTAAESSLLKGSEA